MKKDCIVKTENKIIVFSENRSLLRVNNKDEKKLTKVIVDGCEITEGIRCDNMLFNDDFEYFIELKGTDVRHAFEQLRTSINKLSSNARRKPKICFVVTVRTPLSSASIQNARVKFRRDFNSQLIVKNSPCSHTI